MSDFLEALSTDGLRVLEADLGAEEPTEWIARARKRRAELLWLHTDENLRGFGFQPFPGYTRLHAEKPAQGEPLPPLRQEDFAAVQDAAFRGLWGHKLVATDAAPPPGALVLGLYEGDEAVGLCTIFPTERLVDGPGVRAGRREPPTYARLLLAACAELGDGAVDLDSWGDDPAVIAAYEERGFSIVERVAGWQLRLV